MSECVSIMAGDELQCFTCNIIRNPFVFEGLQIYRIIFSIMVSLNRESSRPKVKDIKFSYRKQQIRSLKEARSSTCDFFFFYLLNKDYC